MNHLVTYTRGTYVYVTMPQYESQFLDWLQKACHSPRDYLRETSDKVGFLCSQYAASKQNATVLSLVKKDGET